MQTVHLLAQISVIPYLFMVTAVALTSPVCLIFFSLHSLSLTPPQLLLFDLSQGKRPPRLTAVTSTKTPTCLLRRKTPQNNGGFSFFFWSDEFRGIRFAVVQRMTNKPDSPRTHVERTLDWPWGCHDGLTLCQLILCLLNQGFSL